MLTIILSNYQYMQYCVMPFNVRLKTSTNQINLPWTKNTFRSMEQTLVPAEETTLMLTFDFAGYK